jgi:uncharacterized protein (DUF2267 family)
MPINLREDLAYILLKKISEGDAPGKGKHAVFLTEEDLVGRDASEIDILSHLDYLNQKQYIKADFTGNAYALQDDVPNAVDSEEVDARVANTFGAPDGPLPHLIKFKAAELTERGRKLLEKMEENPPESLRHGPAVAIATKDMPFLEKVMLKGNLADIFDARDITEVVFRTMRDMMTNEAADRVESELHEMAAAETDQKSVKNDIADLWTDTNPIVHFLSRVRPPLIIKSDTFLFRVRQEAGLQPDVSPETVIKGVFSATKDELSSDRIAEVANFLPDKIRELWETA